MDKGKKTILIILGLIMVILLIIILIFNSQENNNPNSNEPIEPTPSVNNQKFIKLTDYDEYFSVQKAINDNININESFIAEEIYTNNINFRFYFVGGIIMENGIAQNNYRDSINYLVIVDSNNNYEIKKLESNIDDLQGYANDYNIQNVKVNSGKKFKKISVNSEALLKSYIEYFKNLLINVPSKAYAMLDSDTKNKYTNIDDFSEQKYAIYNLLSSNIFSYSKKENQEVIYYIEDKNRNKITIYENNVMNFKISY